MAKRIGIAVGACLRSSLTRKLPREGHARRSTPGAGRVHATREVEFVDVHDYEY